MDIEDRDGAPEALAVELEDAATRSVWTSMLGLLSSGTQMWHFVRRSDAGRQPRGSTAET
jgi:hypothetical protein